MEQSKGHFCCSLSCLWPILENYLFFFFKLIAGEKLASFKESWLGMSRRNKLSFKNCWRSFQLMNISFTGYFLCRELQTCENWIQHSFRQNFDSDIKEELINFRNNHGVHWWLPGAILDFSFGTWQKELLLCWCILGLRTCVKLYFPACFTSKPRAEIDTCD